MKRIVNVVGLLLLFGCSVCMSGEIITNDIEVIRKVGEVVHGLQLSIEMGKSSYKIGEKIEIIVILENVGEEEIQLIKRNPFSTFDIDLCFADGPPSGTFVKKDSDVVPLTLFGQINRNSAIYKRSQLKLTSQQEYRVKLDLNRFFDLSLAGQYKIAIGKKLSVSSDKELIVTVPVFLFTIEEE